MSPHLANGRRDDFFAEVASKRAKISELRPPAANASVAQVQQRNAMQSAQMQALAQMQAAMQRQGQDILGSLPRTADPIERPSLIEVDNLRDEFFDELAAQNAALLSGPPGTIMGDLPAQVMRRNQLQSLAEGSVQRVFINPASAYKGVLGGAAKQANGAPAQRVVNWFADRMDEAIPLSIMIAPIDSDEKGVFTAGGAQNRAYANIYWLGGRGAPMSARVDIGKGKQFSIHGSFCAVDVGLDTGNVAGAMNLGAWLSFWPVSRVSPATTTMFVDALAALGTQTLIIPSCATGLLPVQATTATAGGPNLQMQLRDRNATVIARLDLQAYGQMVATQPMPADAYDLLITNNDAVNTVTARFVFQLAL